MPRAGMIATHVVAQKGVNTQPLDRSEEEGVDAGEQWRVLDQLAARFMSRAQQCTRLWELSLPSGSD